MSLNDIKQAETHFIVARGIDPNEPHAWLGLARIALARGEAEDARQLAERAVQLAPGERAPLVVLGRACKQLGQDDQAAQHLEAALKLPDGALSWRDPVTAEVLQLRRDTESALAAARQFLSEGRVGEAIDLMRRVAQTETRDPGPAVMLGRTLTELGQLPDAAATLNQAIERFPDSAVAHFQLGVVYFLEQRFDKAADKFEAAIQRKPDYALAHYNLGHTRQRLGQADQAIEAFAGAIRSRPQYAQARIALARLLLAEGRTEEARTQLDLAAKVQPDDAELLRLKSKLGG